MDFTINKYIEFLNTIASTDYSIQTFEKFLTNPKKKSIVLRHDVDLLPQNSLRFAKIQNELGIKGSYYFRAVPESWDEKIIEEIASLGHEIGYHYENLTTCKGDLKEGILDFKKNLEALRRLAPVSTICMHGSPLSEFDSKDLWKEYDYQDLNIIGEPYFDIDFNEVFYLTDTGRQWDGHKVSIRDKVNSLYIESYHTTDQIIDALQNNKTPNQIMFTFHPQRWNNNLFLWTKELIFQNIKNVIKKQFYIKN